VLLAKGDPRWIPLGNAKQVDKLVRRYSNLAGGYGNDDEVAADLKALYEAVWAPLEPQLPKGTHRLIVSPDGQLNSVSMATLLTPEGQFLAEKFKVQYVSSGRELLRDRSSISERNVILFAVQDFGTNASADYGGKRSASEPMTQWRGTEKRGLQGGQFGPLPATLDESKRLLQLFDAWHWSTQPHIGPEATKAALLKVRSPFILHLATHGFFEPQEPSKSAESELTAEKPTMFQSKFFANPMHQSGLVFSGGNLTLKLWDQGQEAASVEDDGILTAEDVSTLEPV
jgi:CHAT domain-containing protein